MGNSAYTLIPVDIGNFNIFGTRKAKSKGCPVRREYERWETISRKASEQGVEMNRYHQVLYGHRCPLVKKVSVVNSAKM